MSLLKSLISIQTNNKTIQNNNTYSFITTINQQSFNTSQQKNQDYSNVRLLGVRLNINP